MPTTSSLLKSAQSARKKVQAYNDQYQAFLWDNSAQTYEDFKTYSAYLEGRQKASTDPSEQLTLIGKIKTANRSYVSNEIQRKTQDIQEGNASTIDKLNLVRDLWQQAIDNGDYNLGQNLVSQYNALSIQLQNESEASARQLATGSTKAQKAFENALTKGTGASVITDPETGNRYVELPGGQLVRPLNDLKRELQENASQLDQASFFANVSDTMEALGNSIVDAYNNATTQEQRDALEEKYGPNLVDLDKKLTFDAPGDKMTFKDVVNAEANAKFNNALYGLSYDAATGEFKLKKNNVESTDYVRQFTPDGQEVFVPATLATSNQKNYFGQSNVQKNLDTQITDTGYVIDSQGNIGTNEKVKRDEGQSIGERLKRAGVSARMGQNGELIITRPGENIERQATIQDDGTIRFVDENGNIREIALTDRNIGTNDAPIPFKAGQERVVDPNELSDFGTQSSFGGQQSLSSAQGANYVRNLTNPNLVNIGPNSPVDMLNSRITSVGNAQPIGGISIGNDFSGNYVPFTSALLQSASVQRQQRQLALQGEQMAQATQQLNIQGPPLPGLNTTPVQQLTANGVLKQQLKVAPVTTPKITSVGVAPRQANVSVGVARPTSRITF